MSGHPVQISEPVLQPKLWPWAVGAFVLLIVETYFLLYDFQPSEQLISSRSRTIIATYFNGTNDVRKKEAGTITWTTPVTGQDLYFEDSVMTLPESSATVGFIDGSELSIDPESLVVLSKTPLDRASELQEIVIRLGSGSFRKSKGGTSPLIVEVGADRIEDKTGESLFSVRQTQQGSVVSVTSGKVSVVLPNQKKTEILPNQRGVLSQHQIHVEEQTWDLMDPLPANGSRISRIHENQPVQISGTVKQKNEAEKYRLTLSNASDFLRILKSVPVKPKNEKGFFLLSLEGLKDETYYWRIESNDGKLKTSAQRFEIFTLSAPEILEPDEKTVQLGESTLFRIRRPPNVKSFQLELSLTKDFKTLLSKTYISTSNGVEFTPNEKGVFYWRIRSNYGPDFGISEPGSARKVIVIEKVESEKTVPAKKATSKPALKAPKIFTPKVRPRSSSSSLIRFLDWISGVLLPAAYAEEAIHSELSEYDEELEVDLEWEKIKEAKRYHLQISESSNFKKILVNEKIRNPKYTFYTEKKGRKQKFFFRVAVLDSEGNTSPFSDAVPFEIEDDPNAEAKRTFLGQRRLELSAGLMVHFREFNQNIPPRRVRASGMLPTLIAMESRAAISKRVDFNLSLRTILEVAESTTANVERKTQPVHVFTGWAVLERKLLGQTAGIGLYGTTSQTATWVKRELLFELKPLAGLALEYKNLNTRSQNWHWRVLAGVLFLGTPADHFVRRLGADICLGIKRQVFSSKPSRAREFKGFHVGGEALGRWMQMEKAFGAALKVGYAF